MTHDPQQATHTGPSIDSTTRPSRVRRFAQNSKRITRDHARQFFRALDLTGELYRGYTLIRSARGEWRMFPGGTRYATRQEARKDVADWLRERLFECAERLRQNDERHEQVSLELAGAQEEDLFGVLDTEQIFKETAME